MDSVEDPFTTPGAVSPDERTLVAHARLDVVNPLDMPVADTQEMIALAEAADRRAEMFTPSVEPLDDGFTLSMPDRLRPLVAERRR